MSPFIARSLEPLTPSSLDAPVWPARKRLLFVVVSSMLLWYVIVRLATTI
jgi:hypothetical protein